jgi:copper chaperone CopZ
MTGRRLAPRIGILALGLLAAGCSAEGGDTAGRSGSSELAVAEFTVEGMTCGGCALATEMAVMKLEGVASADASYDEATGEGSCTVEYDPSSVAPDRIVDAIRGAGFEPRLREGGSG